MSDNENVPEFPISEVDQDQNAPCASNIFGGDGKYLLLLEQQNRHFLAMLEALKETRSSNVLHFPDFDPDRRNVDARAWIATADTCIADGCQQGAPLMIALSRAMKGDASTWLSTVSFPGMTWENFKELFTARYACPETVASFLINMASSRPKENECLASYGASLMTSVMSRWKNLTIEQIAVATVLAHISQFEPRIQRLSCTTDIDNRKRLQQELTAVSFLKRKSPPNSDALDSKRVRAASTSNFIECFHCGKLGHKSTQCFSKRSLKPKEDVVKNQNSFNKHKKSAAEQQSITCYACHGQGHYASNCPVRRNKEGGSGTAGSSTEKRVDVCNIDAPFGYLYHNGERFPFYFDSGAECSLIKESVSSKFSGKRLSNIVNMTGIGQTSVQSTLQILTTIKTNNIVLEILFHVLPDFCLRYDIMLGREILSQGLIVHMTGDCLRVEKSYIIESCSVLSDNTVNLDSINTDVSLEYREELIGILKSFQNSFITGVPMTRAKADPMTIRLIDPHKTVNRRPYRLSPQERQIVRDKVNELLAANIIRPSSSPFASPILLIKKKDGSDRMCVDYRELNDNTVPDRFPLPLISDQIARLNKGNFFTICDMASGFHQIPLESESIERTAFVTTEGQYEYLTMPFGLKNAPAVFQRAIIKALGDLVNTYVVVYMDDVLIVASTIHEALERLKTVLKVLTDQGFSLNIKKCAFLKQKVEYLGYEVCRGEIRPNPRKIEALSLLSPPSTVTQLRQFIGLASYFRQFIAGFSQKMAPLYALTSSNKGKLDWKSEHEAIRQRIISILTREPVLMIYDPDLQTELHTDASAEGYGAVLMQRKAGKLHAVAYFSKRTTAAESKYHSYELETLAVVNAVKHFRHYLHGRKFTVVTDCNSLQSTRKKLDLTPRVHRWWAFLQGFDFDVVHVNGKRMAHADFFSRNPVPAEVPQVSKPVVESRQVNVTELSTNWLLAEQQRDDEISKLVSDLKDNKLPDDVSKTYEFRSGILHRKIQRNGKTRSLPIIPRSLRWSVTNGVHEGLMHLGWEKTLEKVYEFYWFDKMTKYVRKFVDNCITCKISKSNSGKTQVELHPIPKVAIPWHTIHIDATGKLSGKSDNKEYVFVVIDAFTKFVLLHHALHIDAVSSIRAVKASVSLFGAPTRIIADQGRCFTSKDFKDYCESVNIKLHLIATGSSRANGQVERTMSTLKSMLTAVETSDRSWQEALPDVQLALNCSQHRVTASSPLELLIGKVSRPVDILLASDVEPEVDIVAVRERAVENIAKNSQYDKIRFDSSKAKPNRFSIGDFVLLKNEERNQTKLDPKFKGPFKVVEVLEGDRYVLQGLNSNRTYKYAHDRLRKMPGRADCDRDSDDDCDVPSTSSS